MHLLSVTMEGHQGFSQVGGSGLTGRLGDLGDRTARRAEPRVGIGLAGVGMLMVLIGVVVWAFEAADDEDLRPDERPDTTLGILLSLVVVVAGFVLLARYRRGPLATAGVVASGLGVPVLLAFLTFDPSLVDDEVYADLPFSIDAIALLSLAAWLIAFARVPHARGRAFYLAASSAFLWLYLVEKVEEGAIGYLVTLPVGVVLRPLSSAGFEQVPQVPEAGNIGSVSLLVGLAYYVFAAVLDRRDLQGAATPLTAVGFVATALGVAHLGGDLEAAGTGILLVAVGSALAVYGAVQRRRFTTWTWCLGIGLGVLLIIGDVTEDSATAFGITAIVLGAAVVVAAHLLTGRFGEPDEMEPVPSRFTSRPAIPPPWAAYPPGPPAPPYPPPGVPGPPRPPGTF